MVGTPATNTERLRQWLAIYERLIYRVVVSYEVDLTHQQDLFQEIVIALWQSMAHFRDEAKESTWIYRVALNTAIDYTRKVTRQPRVTPFVDEHHWVTIEPIDEDLQWIYEHIRKLDVVDRSLMLLYLDGNSYTDISAILGLTETNIGAKINRIKNKLKKTFQQETNHD